MRKIIKSTGIWIMAFICMLLFNCEDPEPFRKDSILDLETSIDPVNIKKGHWTAIHAERKDYTDRTDLTEYFKDFQVTIDEGMALCCINGCETWRSVIAWENNCTIFEKIQDRNTMFFVISSVNIGPTSYMMVIIQKGEPGFSFLPEKWNTGDYIVTFTR